MAKGKYAQWLEPEKLLLLEGWARDGLTDEQIAQNIGISASTLYEWKRRYPEMSEALKRGKEIVDILVENALFKKALSGDVTAQIFWLKNRRPKKWRDKPVDEAIDQMTDQLQKLREMFEVVKNGHEHKAEWRSLIDSSNFSI